MLFDHDAKVSGDSARFADLPGGPAGVRGAEGGGRPGLPGQGHESGNLRAEMTALSALAPATAPETRPGPAGQRGCGVRATGCSLSRRRLERPHRRHGDHADRDAILRRSRRADPHRRLPRVPAPRGQLRPGTEDHTIGKPRRDVGLLAPVLARHLAAGRTVRPVLACGLAGRWPLPAVLRRTQPGRRRPNAPECTHFARRISRRGGERRPSRGPGQRVPVDPVPLCEARHAGQAGSRLPLPAEDGRPQISRDMRYRETSGGTAGAAFLPDAPGRIGVPSP